MIKANSFSSIISVYLLLGFVSPFVLNASFLYPLKTEIRKEALTSSQIVSLIFSQFKQIDQFKFSQK